MWSVYVLRCSDDTFYTGITKDIERRIDEHNKGEGAKYTRGRTPVELKYQEELDSQSEAAKREHEIKSLKREEKKQLFS